MLLLPLWLLDFSGLIKSYIWDPPEAIEFMFIVYHIELVTDMIITLKAKQLSGRLAFRKVIKVLLSCLGAAVLLFVCTGAARYGSGFGWLPQTTFFLILAGLILIIARRCSNLGILTPVVAEVLEIRIQNIINSKKNDSSGDQSGGALPVEGHTQAVQN